MFFFQYGRLHNTTVGNHEYEKTGSVYTPLSLCQEFYRNGTIYPGNDTFEIDARVESGRGGLFSDYILMSNANNSTWHQKWLWFMACVTQIALISIQWLSPHHKTCSRVLSCTLKGVLGFTLHCCIICPHGATEKNLSCNCACFVFQIALHQDCICPQSHQFTDSQTQRATRLLWLQHPCATYGTLYYLHISVLVLRPVEWTHTHQTLS